VRALCGDLPGLVLLFLGDLGASRGPDREESTYPRLFKSLSSIEALEAVQIACSRASIAGDDIMGLFD